MDIVVQKSYVEQIKVGIMQIMNNILLVLPVLNLELSVARLSMCVWHASFYSPMFPSMCLASILWLPP